MVRYFLPVVFVFTVTGKALGQDSFALIDSAVHAFNEKDTGRTIRYLEAYVHIYPESWIAWLANVRLAGFYKKQYRYDSAMARLTCALQSPFKYNYEQYPPDSSGEALLSYWKWFRGRGDVFADLGDLYTRIREPEKALACFKKADSCYHRSNTGCGNDFRSRQTYLSIKYADWYISAGDTSSAINRLLEYCFWGEDHSPEAIRKLCPLLLSRYTASAILKEFERGVAHSYGKNEWAAGKKVKRIHFSLFGYHYQSVPMESAEELRKYLPNGRGYQLLKEIVVLQN